VRNTTKKTKASLHKSDVKRQDSIENIKTEKNIMKRSKSNFVTRMHSSFRNEESYHIVMEWAQGGDVFTFIDQKSKRYIPFMMAGEPAVRFILGCVVLGLEYLHSQDIVYWDMKPENLLVFEDGYVKLSDFGLSTEIKGGPREFEKVGTTLYFAPELVRELPCGKALDLWTLGILAYELSNFASPFSKAQIQDKNTFHRAVTAGESNRKWNNRLSPELKDLINQLLRLDPGSRLGASGWEEIKSHSFFSGFDWKALEEKTMESPLLAMIDDKMCLKKVSEWKLRQRKVVDY
jgi:serine/threonine protein kinase